jgi:hypothetical protein
LRICHERHVLVTHIGHFLFALDVVDVHGVWGAAAARNKNFFFSGKTIDTKTKKKYI